jgi:hypothetical protein
MSPLSFGFSKSNITSKSISDLAVQYARYFVFEYQFTNGNDLDTRTGFIYPAIGAGNSNTQYEGWNRTGNEFLYWSGDNTGTGFESCYIDKEQVLSAYPDITYIEIDLRCFWYSSVGTNPVIIKTNAYAGGTMVKSGFQWVNPTATYSFPSVFSVGKVITNTNRSENGERASRVVLDFINFTLNYYQD